jgi:hypothetical protein
MEFVGHGACGLHTKAAWLPYFRVFAVPESVAWKLMPVVGTMDVILGLLALLFPTRAALLYMGAWGLFTALLRPAAGEGGWEFVERAYNFGIPWALLCLHGFPARGRDWFARLSPRDLSLSVGRGRELLWGLRGIVALMLVGHGGFGAFMAKKNLLAFYQGAGLGGLGIPLESIRAGIGFLEIALGIVAFLKPNPRYLFFLFVWKLGSELLFPISGADLACWEVIERGGSYVAPLALMVVLQRFASPPVRPPLAHA